MKGHETQGDTQVITKFRDIPNQLRMVDTRDDSSNVVDKDAAISAIRESGLQLVCMAPDARPPVYKLIDWGKYQYEQSKKTKKQNLANRQKNRGVKEHYFGVAMADHDIDVRIKRIRTHLDEGYDVKIGVKRIRQNLMALPRGRPFQDAMHDENFVLHRVSEILKGDEYDVGKMTAGDRVIMCLIKPA